MYPLRQSVTVGQGPWQKPDDHRHIQLTMTMTFDVTTDQRSAGPTDQQIWQTSPVWPLWCMTHAGGRWPQITERHLWCRPRETATAPRGHRGHFKVTQGSQVSGQGQVKGVVVGGNGNVSKFTWKTWMTPEDGGSGQVRLAEDDGHHHGIHPLPTGVSRPPNLSDRYYSRPMLGLQRPGSRNQNCRKIDSSLTDSQEASCQVSSVRWEWVRNIRPTNEPPP